MRRLVAFNMMSIDGFFSGPKDTLDWNVVDDEFNTFALQQMRSVDSLLFGRVTYQLMAGYWPTAAARANDPIVARTMNETSKLVISRTLEKADWNNTRLLRGEPVAEALALKQQPGRDIMVFGSATLMDALTESRLIDEFRIMVNPVVLREGRPLFSHARGRLPLYLFRVQEFRSGNVLLTYRPKR